MLEKCMLFQEAVANPSSPPSIGHKKMSANFAFIIACSTNSEAVKFF